MRDGGAGGSRCVSCAGGRIYRRVFCKPFGLDFCRFVFNTGVHICDQSAAAKKDDIRPQMT